MTFFFHTYYCNYVHRCGLRVAKGTEHGWIRNATKQKEASFFHKKMGSKTHIFKCISNTDLIQATLRPLTILRNLSALTNHDDDRCISELYTNMILKKATLCSLSLAQMCTSCCCLYIYIYIYIYIHIYIYICICVRI